MKSEIGKGRETFPHGGTETRRNTNRRQVSFVSSLSWLFLPLLVSLPVIARSVATRQSSLKLWLPTLRCRLDCHVNPLGFLAMTMNSPSVPPCLREKITSRIIPPFFSPCPRVYVRNHANPPHACVLTMQRPRAISPSQPITSPQAVALLLYTICKFNPVPL